MRNYTHFSKTERLELSVLLKKGYSLRDIGSALKKSPSSVSREVRRNKVNGIYDPQKANHKAYVKRLYSKYQGMKVRERPELETYIWWHMPLYWSPERIAGRWKLENPNSDIQITAKGIYKYLYSQYGQRLCPYLKYKRYRRKPRKHNQSIKILISDRIWVDQRPEAITKRLRFGDFEGDTMGRPKYASSQTLAVLRERLSRKLFAIKVPRLKYAMDGFKFILKPYQNILNSVTLDNGVENVRHRELKADTYFCHPYSSWEKGMVENGIGLIREFIPKKADLKDYPQNDISAIVEHINSLPMKCLGFKTPNEVFEEHITNQGVALRG